MKIRKVSIKNFRGIEKLLWFPNSNVSCLIGPGDSTKTTILNAIEYALFPGWMLKINDSDFYKKQTDQPIEISITIGQLDDDALSVQGFGLHLEGFCLETSTLYSEPSDESYEPVVTVHFLVDKELEPQWFVKRPQDTDSKVLQAKHRKKFKVIRLSENHDYDLGWGKGSALTKLTETDVSNGIQFPELARLVTQHVDECEIEHLESVVTDIEKKIRDFSVRPNRLKPGLNPKSFSLQGSGLVMHDSGIPVTQYGTGSKRLMSLAMQKAAISTGAIVLIDEIEVGLEPHRLKNLLEKFGCFSQSDEDYQLIFTTHSPTSVMCLGVEQIGFVSSSSGNTVVKSVSVANRDTVQGCVRKHGVALFAKRVLIGEGATEVGLLRGFFEKFESGRLDLSQSGVEVSDGSGQSRAPGYAIELSQLGYEVLLLCDSDVPISPDQSHTVAAGVETVLWSGNVATEERIFLDLNFSCLNKLLKIAVKLEGEDSIIDSLESYRLKASPSFVCQKIEKPSFNESVCEISTAGLIVGTTAKKGKWFKTIDGGLSLGHFLAEHWDEIKEMPVGIEMGRIISWLEKNTND